LSKVYGIGIIGAGGIFAEHARAYTQLPERTRIVGLADIDAARLKRAARDVFIPVMSSDYRELLGRDDIDIVDICTPPCLHERMVVDALQAGKYVLCEKPLAHTLAAADRIIDVARQYPGRLSIIYQLRFAPEVQRTIWLRDRGLLGSLKFGRFSRYGSLSGVGWWGQWQVAGGGAVMTQCIHELDLVHHIFGPAKCVFAAMDTLGNSIESEDTFSATIWLESGAMVSCFATLAGKINHDVRWDVVGASAATHLPWSITALDRGLRLRLQREALKHYPSTNKRLGLPGMAGKAATVLLRRLRIGGKYIPSRHRPYVLAFLRSIESAAPAPVPPKEARASLELCVAIYTSALTGQPVHLPLQPSCPFYGGITTRDYDGRKTGATS
jgi:predicted dehydrogenase